MRNELFLEFVQFCDNKPLTERVSHDSWEKCFVGDFFEALEEDCTTENIEKLLNPSWEPNSIYSDINMAWSRSVPDNYGEFTAWLKAHPDFNRTAGV